MPLHWIVWDYFALREDMRLDSIIEDNDRIREGVLTAMATHQPKLLEDEDRKLKARARAFDAGLPEPRPRTRKELLAHAARMHADISTGGALADTPLPVS